MALLTYLERVAFTRGLSVIGLYGGIKELVSGRRCQWRFGLQRWRGLDGRSFDRKIVVTIAYIFLFLFLKSLFD